MRLFSLLPIALLVGCTGADRTAANEAMANAAINGITLAPSENGVRGTDEDDLTPLDPPGPGEPGGLPDDRTPVSEAPFSEESAQGAANIVQSYHALIESGRYDEAWRLWSQGGQASGMSAEAFAASFDRFREYHARIGAPGRIEGAAGSLYVEVPVQVYGRLRNGEPFNMIGPVRLRRCNDVPGCSEEARKWRIVESGIRPRPAE